jgi:DNA-binding response OmpR family regulator
VHGAEATDPATHSILSFIEEQSRMYARIKSLTPIKPNEVYFGEGFRYDVLYRTFYLNNIELKRFSTKEGKLLEILARNYRKVIKRDIVLEEVWHKTDIYSSRSSDVYVTKLRNFFKEYDLNLTIKNISGVGLILE